MNENFRLGQWLVQPSLNSVTLKGKTARLEPKAMEVLVCLARHAGNVVSKEQLIGAVWPGTFVTDDVLIRCISELRKALDDDAKDSRVIETIPKKGYRLLEAVEWVAGPEPQPWRERIARRFRQYLNQRRRSATALALIVLTIVFAFLLSRSWLARF